MPKFVYLVTLWYREENPYDLESLGIFTTVKRAQIAGEMGEKDAGWPSVAVVERFDPDYLYLELTDPVEFDTYYEVRNGIPDSWLEDEKQ